MTQPVKPTLSAALIVKNEAKNLEACLASLVGWVDDIVLLDSGSTDNTEQIARQYTQSFYHKTDWQGFGLQRQAAQAFVKTDYVLWVDADEVIGQALKDSILSAVAANKPDTAYSINRKSWVFGRFIEHSGWYPDRVTRLYKVSQGRYSDDLVHEKVILNEGVNLLPLAGDMTHYTYDDLHHYLVKSASYAKLSADQKEQRGKTSSLSNACLHAFACFVKMYILKRGFLDGQTRLFISGLVCSFHIH